MKNGATNVMIGGEAGQGLVTVGEILTKSLGRSGYSVVVIQDYQSRVRGGHNTYSIRVSNKEDIFAPQESIDILVALNEETLDLHRGQLGSKAVIIADEKFAVVGKGALGVPFSQLSEAQFSNVAALGVASAVLGLAEETVAGVVSDYFGKKHPEAVEKNRQTLSKAYGWAATSKIRFQKLRPAATVRKTLVINGNDAIALGAISAGLKFYSFYPMTPSTSIGNNLAAASKKMGLVVEQAEDEIAAINMAIGASFAGVPSMVGTSGGGFALMVEGISVAAMTETPVVVVVGQRPAPATGLPTRTEQADLEFVLHAGHGEFPRAIFSPGSIGECFHLTRKAFQLAQKYQGPMFVLTDQYLGDSYQTTEPFDIEKLSAVKPWDENAPSTLPYKRFAFTQTGVSPRLIPGLTGHLVVADSDEHTEDGHITEDLSIRKKMVEKRLRKMEGIISEVIPPEMIGDDAPNTLLVTWGSAKGAVVEAAMSLRSPRRKVGVLHFSQVWPFVPEQFMPRMKNAKNVVCVEGNAFGQFARLIRRETGFHIKKKVLRYDGLPITPEYVLSELRQ